MRPKADAVTRSVWPADLQLWRKQTTPVCAEITAVTTEDFQTLGPTELMILVSSSNTSPPMILATGSAVFRMPKCTLRGIPPAVLRSKSVVFLWPMLYVIECTASNMRSIYILEERCLEITCVTCETLVSPLKSAENTTRKPVDLWDRCCESLVDGAVVEITNG